MSGSQSFTGLDGARWQGLKKTRALFIRVCFLRPWPGDVRCVTSGPSGVPLPVFTASPVVRAASKVGFDTCFAQRFPPVCLVPKEPLVYGLTSRGPGSCWKPW